MVRKRVEGNEEQKRGKGREAKARGHQPSEEGVTTGASKQRHEVHGGSHKERVEARTRGKQAADVKPSHSLTTRHGRTANDTP